MYVKTNQEVLCERRTKKLLALGMTVSSAFTGDAAAKAATLTNNDTKVTESNNAVSITGTDGYPSDFHKAHGAISTADSAAGSYTDSDFRNSCV